MRWLHARSRDVGGFGRLEAYLDKEGYVGSKPDATVKYRSGRAELVEVKYEHDLLTDVRAEFQVATRKKTAGAVGATWSV